MQKLRNIFFIFAILFGGTVYTQAQSVDTLSTVQFLVSPEAPGPNQTVTIEAQGVGGFLGDANLTWQQDGKTILSGVGEHSFSFTTGAVGKQTRISVSINSASKGAFTKDFVFVPGTVNLLWEANTSAPPLYRSKTLYSPGSLIKVVALPQILYNGSYLSSNSLSFQWSVNNEPVTTQSGLGRSTLIYSGNQLNQNESLSVDVFLSGSKVAHADLLVPTVSPELLLYVKDPLRGILFDQALPGAVSLSGAELTLSAQPYYFANESFLQKTLVYTWTLGGQAVSGPDADQGVLTLRQSGSGKGQSSLSVELQNTDTYKFFQTAAVKLQILFGAQTSSGGAFGI